jgi:hypothetical protein
VRTHYAPALARANTALQRYAQERPNETTLRGLRQAARTLDAAGREVRAIAAPPDAAGVRRALIRLYDLEAALARDIATTAAFSPQAERALAPLKPATAEFNRHAKTDRTSETQAVALATYAAKLRMTAHRLVPWRRRAFSLAGSPSCGTACGRQRRRAPVSHKRYVHVTQLQHAC